jgi:hypothetical protein
MKKSLFFLGAALPLLTTSVANAAFIIDKFEDTISTTGFDSAENAAGRDMVGEISVGSGVASFNGFGVFMWDGVDSPPAYNSPNPENNQSWDWSPYTHLQLDVSNMIEQTILIQLFTGTDSSAVVSYNLNTISGPGNWNTISIPFSDFTPDNPSFSFADIDTVLFLNDDPGFSMDNFEANSGFSPVPEPHEYGMIAGAVCLGMVLVRRRFNVKTVSA